MFPKLLGKFKAQGLSIAQMKLWPLNKTFSQYPLKTSTSFQHPPSPKCSLSQKLGPYIAPTITFQFLLNHHPFLLKAIVHVDKNILPFQQQLKIACELLLPPIKVCLLSFEEFIGQ